MEGTLPIGEAVGEGFQYMIETRLLAEVIAHAQLP